MKNLKLLSEIALSFKKLDEFDRDMDKVLSKIGRSMDISRIYVMINKTQDIMDNAFEWCNEGVSPQIHNLQNIEINLVPSWKQIFKQEGYIYAEDIGQLPKDLIESLKPQGIKSLLVYPLIINEETIGYIGFDECRYKRQWKEEELEILSTVSGIIANTYERKFFQEDIIDSEANFHNFFETIDDIFIVADLDGRILHCNKALSRKLGYSLPELRDMNIIELHPLDQRGQAARIVDKMLKRESDCCSLEVEGKGGKIFSVETRIWFGKWNKQDCIFSISKDVTKEKESLDKYTNIIEGTNLGTWEWNIQTGELVINEQWARMIGYSLDELGEISIETWNRFAHPEDLKASDEVLEKHLKGERSYYNFETRMEHKDGHWIWVQDRGKITQRDTNGLPLKMFGTHLDICERKQAEEKLRESEKRFLLALEKSQVGLWDYDMINHELFLSATWKQLLGYQDHEIENTFESWQSRWHPEDADNIIKAMRDYQEGKTKINEITHRLRHRDGGWRWILTRSEILKDDRGKPYRWIGTNIDVTNEREQALELERFFSVNLDLLCIMDRDGNFIKTNKAWEDILGYSPGQLETRNIMDFIHPDDIDRTVGAMDRLRNAKKVTSFINKLITADGDSRYIEWRSNPYEGVIYAAARDITDRIEYERKILEISNRDSLTNIYNRRYVFQRVGEIIEEYKRLDKIFSLVIFDLDNFKLINDMYGHQTGDYILREFTKLVDINLRPYDIFGRYGGEEFILVLNNVDKEDSKLIIERILNVLRSKTFAFRGKKISCTFSAGITDCREIEKDSISIDKLVALADKRMYDAKANGKNQIIWV